MAMNEETAYKDPAAAQLREVERALHLWMIPNKQEGSKFLVTCTIDLSSKNLTKLPNFSCVLMTGNFYCYDNSLSSLEGSPASVSGGF